MRSSGPCKPPTKAINISDKFAKFSEHWSPKIIAQINDYHVKLAKIKGEYHWHSHPETDEVFIVIQGRMTIHLRDGEVSLQEGEMLVVPQGVEHKPTAVGECQIMLVEPAGISSAGETGEPLTPQSEVWI